MKVFTLFQRSLLVLLGVSIVATGAVGTFLMIRRVPLPVELLPADEIIAYWHVTEWDAVQQNPTLALAPGLPRAAPGFDLALVQAPVNHPSGGPLWILFPVLTDPLMTQAQTAKGGLRFIASDPAAAALLTGTTPRLKDDMPFRALTGGLPPTTPFLFSRTATPVQTGIAGWMLGSAQPSSMLQYADGTTRVRLYGPVGTAPGAAPMQVTNLTPAPAMSLALTTPQQTLEMYLSSLPEQERTARETMLKTVVREWLGDDVSLQYDLLPLLQSRAVLSVGARSASGGAIPFLLEGEARGAGVAARMERFQHSAMAMAGAGSVTVRQFEEDVSVPQVAGAGNGSIVTAERDGWTVTTGPGLITAVRGHNFMIGNDPLWMDQRLNPATEPVPLPVSQGRFRAGGTVTQSGTPLFSWHDPSVTVFTGPLPAAFRWAMEEWGQIRQLSFE